jgi:hypothetical protein
MPPSLDRVDRAHAASCVRRDDQTNQLQDRYVVGEATVVFVVLVTVTLTVVVTVDFTGVGDSSIVVTE